MDQGTNRFMKHFKVPKYELQKMQKDFQRAKEASSKIEPEKLKDFEEMSDQVFDFFEEISGKRTNRAAMVAHLHHYFDEGFGPEEMGHYLRAQLRADYFRMNPEKFTLANLFPIKDQDRINMAWDNLAHFQRVLVGNDVEKQDRGLAIRLHCGHAITVGKLREQDGHCFDCPSPSQNT